jgi:hypothetical protein
MGPIGLMGFGFGKQVWIAIMPAQGNRSFPEEIDEMGKSSVKWD